MEILAQKGGKFLGILAQKGGKCQSFLIIVHWQNRTNEAILSRLWNFEDTVCGIQTDSFSGVLVSLWLEEYEQASE